MPKCLHRIRTEFALFQVSGFNFLALPGPGFLRGLMPLQPEMEDRRISPANLVLGCLVFLAAFGGLVASCLVVNAAIPPKISRKTIAPAQQTAGKIGSKPLSDIADGGSEAHSEAPRLAGRTCVNLDGKIFGWDWPNVPFGAIECGDGRRK